MTVTSERPVAAPTDRAPGLLRRLLWPGLTCLVTAAYAVIPALLHPAFYMRGDTAAQFGPTWFHLGEMVRSGQWPPWLDPQSWAGGNYAGEALFGIYNPLNVLVWLFVSASPDLLVAVLVVKVLAMVMLALGTYLVCRDHGAEPWAATVVATALPISGYTLFWDAGSWASGLLAFAYAPWVWWVFRGVLRRGTNPLWGFLVGSLAITQGNPYGTLAVVVIGFALVVEALVARDRRGAVTLVLLGVCVAAWLPLVYLPLLGTAELAARSHGALFSNNGKLRMALGDLFALSSPTYAPDVRAITGSMRVPAVYFVWFLLPLLPWLRYDVLRTRARELVGVATMGAIYLLLTLGPSKLWLFRWPLRQVEYFYLGLGVALAVVLSQGLARDRWRVRLSVTGLLLALACWLNWAEDPEWRRVAFGGPLLLVALTAVVLVLHRRRVPTAVLAAALLAGSALTLAGQAAVFGENASSRVWHFPNDVSALQERFADRNGRVLQFADLAPLQRPGHDKQLRAAWKHYLAGSMYHVAGVEAVNNYTGMGFLRFTRRLCMNYDGLTRACGYRQIWQPVSPGGPPLADLMKLDTVVAQPKLTVGVTPAPGWKVVDTQPAVVEHTGAQPWPGSELSWVSPGVEVSSASTVDAYRQRVQVSDTGAGGTAVFAMLAWPGYTATLDGRPVRVTPDPAGLLTAHLPPGAHGTLEIGLPPAGPCRGPRGGRPRHRGRARPRVPVAARAPTPPRLTTHPVDGTRSTAPGRRLGEAGVTVEQQQPPRRNRVIRQRRER